MHETVIAQSLLAAIENEAVKQSAKPVTAKISCGAFDAVNDEILCFAFSVIARGTVCEGMSLQIEHKPIKAMCRQCNKTFEINLPGLLCPICNTSDYDLMPDSPLLLENIEFDTE